MAVGLEQRPDVAPLVQAALAGQLSERQAEELAALDVALIKLLLLAVASRIAELSAKVQAARAIDPSTPSGQRPIYTKPAARKRKGRPGARKGHPGAHRARPLGTPKRQEHRLERCPECGGELQRCNRTRRRLIEDIPEEVRVEAVEHVIHRDYCPRCRKHVEPVVPDALPKAAIGHRLVALTAWWHYALGVTIAQTVAILHFHLHTRLTAGGLVASWQRLAEILASWYEQIVEEARKSGVLHADETHLAGVGPHLV